jgi:hypothetical protein
MLLKTTPLEKVNLFLTVELLCFFGPLLLLRGEAAFVGQTGSIFICLIRHVIGEVKHLVFVLLFRR